jgi:hypothetical protein
VKYIIIKKKPEGHRGDFREREGEREDRGDKSVSWKILKIRLQYYISSLLL